MKKLLVKNDELKKKIKRIAIYVIYDRDGILDGYRKYYLQELRKVTDHIVVVVSGILTLDSRKDLEKLADDFFVRENKGLLTYAWIDGINHIGWDKLYEYDELLMLNDSFFGPFFPLSDMFDDMEKSDADFYGVMKNFEQKNYTQIANRPLKHGFFRGTICYFYVIKNRLLHSNEFRKYWSKKPEIKENWDAYFFNEFDFYDYVRDAGFKIDAYQSDKLKGYFFDNISHNMYKLLSDDKIPFARIRPFCTDFLTNSVTINYGKDPRKTLEYIDKKTDYDIDLIWDYILRTKNLTDIYNRQQLIYILNEKIIEKKYIYNKKIAVIVHIYYEDLIENIVRYCENFMENVDFFITTTKDKVKSKIEKEFKKRKLNFICKVRPNIGVAMSTLWVTYSNIVTSGQYEYICYFHDKKSPYSEFSIQGEQFATRCYENLFGTPELVKNIINLFEDNPRLGVLGVPRPYNGNYFATNINGWDINHDNVVKLAEKFNLKVDIDERKIPATAYGDMFWFRSDALKKVIRQNLSYKDFDVVYVPDGTFMHAVERIYGLAAQDSGYYYADVLSVDNARSDLVNYQYILDNIFLALKDNGYYVSSPQMILDYINKMKNISDKFFIRRYFKHKLKNHLPRPLFKLAVNTKRLILGPRGLKGNYD